MVCSVACIFTHFESMFLQDTGFYIVSGGASAFYTQTHIRDAIADKEFDVELHDVTDKMGIVSIQGPLRFDKYFRFYFKRSFLLIFFFYQQSFNFAGFC